MATDTALQYHTKKVKSMFGLRRRRAPFQVESVPVADNDEDMLMRKIRLDATSSPTTTNSSPHLIAGSRVVAEKEDEDILQKKAARRKRLFLFKKKTSRKPPSFVGHNDIHGEVSDFSDDDTSTIDDPQTGGRGRSHDMFVDTIRNEGDDNESSDDDGSTLNTLLSSRDGSMDAEGPSDDDDECHNRGSNKERRLRRRLASRNKTLKRLSRVKNPALVKVLRHNEIAVRRATLKNQSKSSGGDDMDIQGLVEELSFDKSDFRKNKNRLGMLLSEVDITGGLLTFECYQGLPAGLLVVVYLLANLHFYNIMSCVLAHLAVAAEKSYGMSVYTFDALAFAAAYIAMRSTGYIWLFVDDESYLAVKFDTHNRARLGYWDAKLLSYFNRHKTFARLLNLTSFFVVSVIVYEWIDYICKSHFEDPITSWYQNITESAYELAETYPDSETLDVDSMSECEVVTKFIEAPWRRLLASYFCRSSDPRYITLPLNIILCVTFAKLQGMLGWNFLDSTE